MHAHLKTRIAAVDALIGERLHVRGSLREKLTGAKGRLPRVALAQANELVEAAGRLQNPATARTLDPTRIEATCAMLERHLLAIPESKYRRRAWSALIGTIALRLLIVLALLLVVLRWRGFI